MISAARGSKEQKLGLRRKRGNHHKSPQTTHFPRVGLITVISSYDETSGDNITAVGHPPQKKKEQSLCLSDYKQVN